MEYIIVTKEWCDNKGILIPMESRRSIDGTKVIFHKEFIKPVLTKRDNIKIYNHDSKELFNILNSDEWSTKDDNTQII